MMKKKPRRDTAVRGSAQLDLKLPMGEGAQFGSIQQAGGSPRLTRSKTKRLKSKRTKSTANRKPSVMEKFAKKLLGGMEFDVQTDLRMIRQETLN